MSRVVYLNALQALDAALRHGSMKGAAVELGVTAAAIGQRIRTLEDFTGTPLLERGTAGVRPTPATEAVAQALRRAFADLDQVAMRLNLDRDGTLRIACDADFLTFWLRPRLDDFAAQFPGVRLAFLKEGDAAPPDLVLRFGPEGQVLMGDWLVPVTSPGNLFRVTDNPAPLPLEGMPLLHVGPAPGLAPEWGWADWVARHPLRRDGADRGFRYARAADALNFAAADVGLALLPLSLVAGALRKGRLIRLFPDLPLLPARNAWRLQLSGPARVRPNLELFTRWLAGKAADYVADLPTPPSAHDLAMELARPAR
jgi:LysR family glycine cleavage system transcriptional activator